MPKRDKTSANGVEEMVDQFETVRDVVWDPYDPDHAPQINVTLEFITPDQAKEWLDTCQYERQRDRYTPHINDMRFILRQRQYSVQSITLCEIDGEWKLTNGQHRCASIVEEGIGVWEVVIRKYGGSSESGATEYSRTDRGKRRRVADAIRAHGLAEEFGMQQPQINQVSGAVTHIITGFGYTKPTIRNRLHLQNQDARVEEVRNWLPIASKYFKTITGAQRGRYKHFTLASTMAVGLVTLKYSPESAEDFWYQAAHNSPNDDADPVLALQIVFRERLIERKDPILFARYVAACWNAFYDKRPLAKARTQSTKEPINIAGSPYQGRLTSSLINPSIAE